MASFWPWPLISILDDSAEPSDLAAAHPKQLQVMLTPWDQYVKETGIAKFDNKDVD